MREILLSDAFKDWATGDGIFDKIYEVAEVPWADEESITASILDFEYFGNHSGARFCSPIVTKLLNTSDEVPDSARTLLATIIAAKYIIPWGRLWSTNVLTYSPINNYDMTETRQLTIDGEENTDGYKSNSHTGTDTLEHGLVDTTEHGLSTDSTSYKYGMNNVTPKEKPSDEVVTEDSGETVVRKTGNDVQRKNLSDEETTDINNYIDRTENETIHKVGNIGVTTNQKLVQEERALWKWNFFEQVFSDIDKELTLCISDPCRV